MTFSTQPWPSTHKEQRNFIRNFTAGLTEAEQATLTPAVIKAVEPSTAEFSAAWANFFGTPNIPINGRIQWFNPDKLRIENIYTIIEDIGGGLSSGKLRQLTPKEADTGIFFLGRDYALSSGLASLAVTDIDQGYKDLLVLFSLRSTVAAATSNQSLRINGASTGHYFDMQFATGSSYTAAESLNSALTLACPGASSDPSAYHTGLMYVRDYADAARAPHGWLMSTQGNGNPISTQQMIAETWVLNTAVAVTSITVVPATASSIDRDSYLAVFGIK